MPVETLRPSDCRLGSAHFASAMPFRILHKGPGYFRRPAETAARKPSAVERLEADKAKYVKSQQVALTRQAPIQAPAIRQAPAMAPADRLAPVQTPAIRLASIMAPADRQAPIQTTAMAPASRQASIMAPAARQAPVQTHAIRLAPAIRKPLLPPGMLPPPPPHAAAAPEAPRARRPPLNLDILMADAVDSAPPCSRSSSSTSPSSSSPSSGATTTSSSLSDRSARAPPLHATSPPSSSPPGHALHALPGAEPSRRAPPVPARAPRFGPPAAVTVRRVDVRPQAAAGTPRRAALRPPARPRQLATGQVAPPPQAPPPPPPSRTTTKPPQAPLPCRPAPPPASPAFTRLSGASSRGSSSRKPAPSLHRSKSDLSDRLSRAGADLERFFNQCGLRPAELEELGGAARFSGRAGSDIVSGAKLRSVSTPSSECDGGGEEEEERRDGEEEEEEEEGRTNGRVPYGISVIERNARVIKWLYGIRQARDAVSNV